mgnify:CR=1 FL=1
MSDDVDWMMIYHQIAEERYKSKVTELEAMKLDKKDLLKLAAQAIIRGDLLEEQYHTLLAERANDGLSKIEDVQHKEIITQEMFGLLQADTTKAVSEVNRVTAQKRSDIARNAANKKHELSGVKEDHESMRQAWASGKYKTKDECAEKEGSKLGMTFDAARRVLYNQP